MEEQGGRTEGAEGDRNSIGSTILTHQTIQISQGLDISQKVYLEGPTALATYVDDLSWLQCERRSLVLCRLYVPV